jgi:hypothetical protein
MLFTSLNKIYEITYVSAYNKFFFFKKGRTINII